MERTVTMAYDYLTQFLPAPTTVKFWAGVLLTIFVASMPKPTKQTGVYLWLYNVAQSLPIPTFSHLKN
jgi:hypothetical protein